MKKALSLTATLIAALLTLLSFCSCNKSSVDTYTQISEVKEKFSSSLTNVKIYSSEIEEGNDGYADRELIAAMLGGDGEFPREMDMCGQYSLFCASSLAICEVWAVECRTYTAARDIEALFERRQLYLSKQDYENASDISAVSNARTKRKGKRVYFAVTENSDEVIKFLSEAH